VLTSSVAPELLELLEPPVAVTVTVTEAPPLAWLLPPAVLDPFEVEVPALPVEEEEDDTGAPELEVVNSGTSARHAGAGPPLNTRSAKSRIRRNTRRR